MSEVGEASEAPVASLDPEQFATWYRDVLPRVYGYLFKATGGDHSRTESVTQDTFMQAVRTLQRGDGQVVTVPWLLSVARSRLIDAARAEARAERKLELVQRSTDRRIDLEGIEISAVHATELLQGLRPMERLALALRYVDDLPVAAVAEHIGRSVRATESILVRARQRLRDQLEGMSDD